MSAISPGAPAFILLFFLLLAFPGQAIQGASDGLLLWFHTVLPTLAPAMICTRLILLSGGDHLLMKPVRPLFQKLFSLSETGSFILLSGMLCGYPLGAALCSQARRGWTDKHPGGGVPACFLQLSEPHVPGRLHSRTISRQVSTPASFSFGLCSGADTVPACKA